MEGLTTLVLLSSVALLCSATPDVEPVTCTDGGISSAQLAMHHINDRHEHGYKFRLNKTLDFKMAEVDSGCNIELTLELSETKCHVVNPKAFDDCDLRSADDWEVKATCAVKITVENRAAKVTSYTCETGKVLTREEMMMTCPNCSVLIALNDAQGLKAAREMVKKFNENTTNQHYFILKEVGRVSLGETWHVAEIALVESNCPMHSRRVPESCPSLCPDRAQHAFCKSSYSEAHGVENFDCEFYPALDTTPLSPGEREPVCGQPPRLTPAGPPGPPGHDHTEGRPPPRPIPMLHPCHTKADQEIHPICESN